MDLIGGIRLIDQGRLAICTLVRIPHWWPTETRPVASVLIRVVPCR